MKQVVIIFGSGGGNTETVCQKVAEVLRRYEIHVTLRRVEKSSVKEMFSSDLCIVAAPTYEHGIILDHFFPFLKELQQVNLNAHPVAVIGLGDAKYDMHYHLESANTLETALKHSNGSLFCRSLRISGLPFPHLEGRITQWAEDIAKRLLAA